MKLYSLRRDPENMGAIPQGKAFLGQYMVKHPYSLRNVIYANQIKKVIVPEGVVLRHQAILTDLVSLSVISFPYIVFSKKFADVLQAFRIPNGLWNKIDLVKRTKRHKYILHTPYERKLYEYINYERSQFELYPNEEGQRKFVEINSLEEFIQVKESLSPPLRLLCRKPVIDPSNVKEDFFILPKEFMLVYYTVTEPLKEAIERAGLTGITFKESYQSKIT